MHLRISNTLWVLFAALATAACNGHPQTVDAMLDFAGGAAGAKNAKALYRAIDERSRFAMDSIVADRKEALAIINADYPSELKATAIAQLGRAAKVKNAQDLFTYRCQNPCLQAFQRTLSPSVDIINDDKELVVRLKSGKMIRVFGPPHARTGFGMVWKTKELDDERTKANRDLKTIRQNAKIYQQRKKLASD